MLRPSAGIPAVPAAPIASSRTSSPTGPPSVTATLAAGVHVRLYNDTGVALRDVKVGFPGRIVIREATMAPGTYIQYMSPDVAYRIASLEAVADGHPYRTTPDDYLGEKPLMPGSYTYSIRLTEGVMFLEFAED